LAKIGENRLLDGSVTDLVFQVSSLQGYAVEIFQGVDSAGSTTVSGVVK